MFLELFQPLNLNDFVSYMITIFIWLLLIIAQVFVRLFFLISKIVLNSFSFQNRIQKLDTGIFWIFTTVHFILMNYLFIVEIVVYVLNKILTLLVLIAVGFLLIFSRLELRLFALFPLLLIFLILALQVTQKLHVLPIVLIEDLLLLLLMWWIIYLIIIHNMMRAAVL